MSGSKGQLQLQYAPTAAVRSDLVVVLSPRFDDISGLILGFKPVLIEALIPESAVKALDVSVLSRTARLNQDVLDAMLLPSFCAQVMNERKVNSDRCRF